jgi:hypothetical protein
VKPIFLIVYGLQVPFFLLASGTNGPTLIFVAVPMMMLVFGAIPLTDFIIARYGAVAWHSRMYSLSHMLALGISASAIPVVAYLHHLTGGFDTMFLIFAVLIATIVTTALLLPNRRDVMDFEPAKSPA